MTTLNLILAHEKRFKETINLVASENIMSPAARYALQSDLNHRYIMPPAHERPAELWEYPNQKFSRLIEAHLKKIMKKLYHGQYADARALSGNNAAGIIFKSLLSEGNTVFSVPANCGGHFTTGYLCKDQKLQLLPLPYDPALGIVDIKKLKELININKPHFLFLDASMQLFPYPLEQMREVVGKDAIISYDASHTFGIIGGGEFQTPLKEGADIIHGSTHKSLFGPQKAMIICREDNEIANKIHNTITPLFVSNAHPHHIASLAIALEEMEQFGREYASQVVSNAKTLGKCLHKAGLKVFFPELNFTKSHQIIIEMDSREESNKCFQRLENIGIHLNEIKAPFKKDTFALRVGLSEVTRRGFKENDITDLSKIIIACVKNIEESENLRKKVIDLSSNFQNVQYHSGLTMGTFDK